MSIQISRKSLRRRAFALAVLPFAVLPAAAARASEPISVTVDQAKLVRMPEKIATIVVGNPMIADVTLQQGGMVVVTGKGYGSTNVIAMDRKGDILSDQTIEVGGPTDRVVTVYRGIERESYSCSPLCQRRVVLGDSQGYFTNAITQGTTLNSSVMQSSAPK